MGKVYFIRPYEIVSRIRQMDNNGEECYDGGQNLIGYTPEYIMCHSTIGGGEDFTNLSPFWEGTARKYPLPGTYLINPLVKGAEFGASLPTM